MARFRATCSGAAPCPGLACVAVRAICNAGRCDVCNPASCPDAG
jgi:hypothetical protein